MAEWVAPAASRVHAQVCAFCRCSAPQSFASEFLQGRNKFLQLNWQLQQPSECVHGLVRFAGVRHSGASPGSSYGIGRSSYGQVGSFSSHVGAQTDQHLPQQGHFRVARQTY